MTALEEAEAFFRGMSSGTVRQKTKLLQRAPWPAVRVAALEHPDAKVRWWALGYLDHHDNDASMATFAQALRDPDPHVRTAALHSIACEACKVDELCAVDVVPALIEVLRHDPEVDLRLRALQQLLYLAGRDDRVRPAIKLASKRDKDPVLRRTANEALSGRFTMPAKRYERSQVRHASTRPRR